MKLPENKKGYIPPSQKYSLEEDTKPSENNFQDLSYSLLARMCCNKKEEKTFEERKAELDDKIFQSMLENYPSELKEIILKELKNIP